MKQEKKKLCVEITGYEDQLNTMARFLAFMQYCGDVGASRTLSLWIDGDGAARLKVDFIGTENRPEINDKEIDGDIIKFFID